MSQPSARRVTKTPCAYFRFLRQLAVAAVLRLHQQCQHQKWAGVVLVVVATVNYFQKVLLHGVDAAIGYQKPIGEAETSVLTAVLCHKQLRCV